MFGRVTIKRALRRWTGWSAVVAHYIAGNVPGPAACILYYHRVAKVDFVDSGIDDRDVTPEVLEQQIAVLAELAELVPLPDLPNRLQQPTARPLVCLTFDDGYANFLSNALPILKSYNAPATLSVVTEAIGRSSPAPFDRWAMKNSSRVSPEVWRPLTWNEIETCLESGLVTLGAHSHRHLRANDCTSEQIREEVGRSAELLRFRFGASNVSIYAYPYGNSHMGHVPATYENAVREAGFKLAVTTNYGHVARGYNPLRLPRVEAHSLDTERTLRAKAQSRLSPFHLQDRCRAAACRFWNLRGKEVTVNDAVCA